MAYSMTAWTRVTTVAHTLSDRYALEQWGHRNVVLGLGSREDLYALATSMTADDKNELNEIVKQAQDAAKARSGANLGSALHRLTERIDSGEEIDVTEAWKPDIDAYCETLADNAVEIHNEWIERIVVLPEFKIAGTLDRLVTIHNDLTVADIKTGANALKYGTGEIAIQLALYANATHMWKGHLGDDLRRDRYGRYLLPTPDEEPGLFEEMPAVNKQTGLVVHLPVGEAQCDLYRIDLEAGLEAALKAIWAREWRRRKDLAHPFERRELTAATTADDDW